MLQILGFRSRSDVYTPLGICSAWGAVEGDL